jgi:hypothetical protein
VRQLVVVDEAAERLMQLPVARGRGRGAQELLDAMVLLLDEGLRVVGGLRQRRGDQRERE